MSWISGPCNDGEEYRAEPEETVTPPSDDEQSEPKAWGGATHFHPYLANQREYPRRPRGTARDAG